MCVELIPIRIDRIQTRSGFTTLNCMHVRKKGKVSRDFEGER
jgi:hypothetical protein